MPQIEDSTFTEFRAAFRRFADGGLDPQDVAGVLIHNHALFTRGRRPEGKPATPRQIQWHAIRNLLLFARCAPDVLTEAGFLPDAETSTFERRQHLGLSYKRWYARYIALVCPKDLNAPPPTDLRDRQLLSFRLVLRQLAKDHGLVSDRQATAALEKAMRLTGKEGLEMADLPGEWTLVAANARKPLFRWNNGKLELCSWAVRDEHPDKRKAAPAVQTTSLDAVPEGGSARSAEVPSNDSTPFQVAADAEIAVQARELREAMLEKGGAIAAALEHRENSLFRGSGGNAKKLSRSELAKKWETTAEKIRWAEEQTVQPALDALRRKAE